MRTSTEKVGLENFFGGGWKSFFGGAGNLEGKIPKNKGLFILL